MYATVYLYPCFHLQTLYNLGRQSQIEIRIKQPKMFIKKTQNEEGLTPLRNIITLYIYVYTSERHIKVNCVQKLTLTLTQKVNINTRQIKHSAAIK